MIAGIEFARCHEARCHGTSATVIQPENRLLIKLNVEILQSIPNTPYLGVTLSTDLKFNILLNKNVAKSYQMHSFCSSKPKILSGEIATSILHFSDTI